MIPTDPNIQIVARIKTTKLPKVTGLPVPS